MSLSSPILFKLLYLNVVYESKSSSYISRLRDFVNYTIIGVVQDVRDEIAIVG